MTPTPFPDIKTRLEALLGKKTRLGRCWVWLLLLLALLVALNIGAIMQFAMEPRHPIKHVNIKEKSPQPSP